MNLLHNTNCFAIFPPVQMQLLITRHTKTSQMFLLKTYPNNIRNVLNPLSHDQVFLFNLPYSLETFDKLYLTSALKLHDMLLLLTGLLL